MRSNQLASLVAPGKTGTCCATTVNVGPTAGSDQPFYFVGGTFYYYTNKTVPMGSITVCATDAADPSKRNNPDPHGEEGFTFTLSVLPPTCGGNVHLNVKQDQARPHAPTRALKHPIYPLVVSLSIQSTRTSTLANIGVRTGLGPPLGGAWVVCHFGLFLIDKSAFPPHVGHTLRGRLTSGRWT